MAARRGHAAPFMDFSKVIAEVVGSLERAGVRYALIGGFAMALRGVQRATADLDFILALDDLSKAEEILSQHGYRRVFRSENVSHFISDDLAWGRIDILHAFRRPSLGMLERAESISVEPGLSSYRRHHRAQNPSGGERSDARRGRLARHSFTRSRRA